MKIEVPRAFKELFEPKRYKIYFGGRGGAKSHAVATYLLIRGSSEKIRVLCARELQVSIGDSVHKLLSDTIDKYGLGNFYQVQNTTITGLNGTEFIFKGLKHNAREIKSMEGIDVAWVEEANNVSDNSWELLIPTIRKERSEIVIIFNPKNVNDPTYQRFVFNHRDDAIVKKVSYRDNPFFPSVLEAERLHLMKTDPEAYNHIWEGEFDTRFSGCVYASWVAKAQEEGRIKPSIYDNTLSVNTAWDLGYDDSTAIWFWQVAGKEVRLIDYYEDSGQDIEFYCDVLKNRTYKYGDHYVPHDASNKLLAAGGRSIVQQAYKLGVNMRVVPATSQQNGIEAARKVLEITWIDPDKCKDGILALNSYHFPYDDDRKTFKSTPLHDFSSHGCDAYEIIGQVMREKVKSDDKPKPKFLNDMTANDIFWPKEPDNRPNERI